MKENMEERPSTLEEAHIQLGRLGFSMSTLQLSIPHRGKEVLLSRMTDGTYRLRWHNGLEVRVTPGVAQTHEVEAIISQAKKFLRDLDPEFHPSEL